MGASRSSQMRAILSGVEPRERRPFFEQLALRIFPGANDASGEVRNEFDPDHPLELTVNCRGSHFATFSAPVTDLDQLVPALGLRKMYVTAATRKAPLFVDTPLFETATFHISMPESMRFASLPAPMTEKNEFGSYSVIVTQRLPNLVDVRRDFHVPVQVIPPARFEAFSRFARRIEDAERQRLTAEHVPDETGALVR
jgi:hypothetical protein